MPRSLPRSRAARCTRPCFASPLARPPKPACWLFSEHARACDDRSIWYILCVQERDKKGISFCGIDGTERGAIAALQQSVSGKAERCALPPDITSSDMSRDKNGGGCQEGRGGGKRARRRLPHSERRGFTARQKPEFHPRKGGEARASASSQERVHAVSTIHPF